MIIWNDGTFSIDNNGIIDDDHKKLIEIINTFKEHYNKLDKPHLLHETLKSLFIYANEHFSREEKIMKECEFPDFEIHKAEHHLLLTQVKVMVLEYFIEKTKVVDKNAIEYMHMFLKHWLTNHVLYFDMEIKKYLN